MPARSVCLTGSLLALLALIVPGAPAVAADFENDFRVRLGGYFPADLPTEEGMIVGLELRNLLDENDGIYYGIYLLDDDRSDTRTLGGDLWYFKAEIEMLPIVVGWFHLWRLTSVNLAFGIGGGLYEVEAFSGGYLPGGGQVSDFEEFRQISDETRFGVQFFGGVDFFPESRWSLMAEARYHAVEDDLGGVEISTGAIVRF